MKGTLPQLLFNTIFYRSASLLTYTLSIIFVFSRACTMHNPFFCACLSQPRRCSHFRHPPYAMHNLFFCACLSRPRGCSHFRHPPCATHNLFFFFRLNRSRSDVRTSCFRLIHVHKTSPFSQHAFDTNSHVRKYSLSHRQYIIYLLSSAFRSHFCVHNVFLLHDYRYGTILLHIPGYYSHSHACTSLILHVCYTMISCCLSHYCCSHWDACTSPHPRSLR
jgi:hypothetical protein